MGIVVVSLLVMAFLFAPLTTATLTWKYNATCAVATDDNQAVLKVTVQCVSLESFLAPQSLKVILSNPEGNTVGKEYISVDDLEDGKETVYVDMADGQPKPGPYLLILKTRQDDRILNRTTVTFTGAQLSIEKVTGTYSKYSDGTCDIKKLRITVRNEGDLPAIISKGMVRVGDEEDDFYVRESVMPGEERTINATAQLPYLKGALPDFYDKKYII